MRELGKTLVVSALIAVLAFGFVACAGSTSRGPVYLKAKQTYYDTSSGDVQSELSWEYDSKGNMVRQVIQRTANGSEVTVEDTYSNFDQDGFPSSHSATNGLDTNDTTYEYVRENGHVVEIVESNGAEESFTYYDTGQVRTMQSTSSSGISSLYEYDEDGYAIKGQSSGGSGGDSNSTLMWTRDDNGVPVSLVYNSTSGGKSQIPVSYTVQCDDNGNISRIYTSFGKLYEEIEYIKVDSPSLAAWIRARRISS